MSAYWMWYPGDFELYHSLKLHLRRTEFRYHRPAFWRLDDCWHNVMFQKKVTLDKTETFIVKTNGIGNVTIGTDYYSYNEPITLEPGTYVIQVLCAKQDGLPCVYVEGDAVNSGPGWEADNYLKKWQPVGYSEMYRSPDDDPEVFKFSYQDIYPVAQTKTENGVLYDFGRETFARLVFEETSAGEAFWFYYGESPEEALDTEHSYLTDQLPAGDGTYSYPSRAFRYILIPDTERTFRLKGEYEYLPLEYKGSFVSSDERLSKIWEVSAYTFHLNSREFFLDGIKRDRWTWSGDAYQSYLTDYYLFSDPELVKRTSTALRGKDPVEQHLNTILDYSFYWIIALADYYHYTGDLSYLRFIWPKAKTLLEFCCSRCNEDGFVIGLENDWVFIDWHGPLDKTGALCAEQMLYLKALQTAAKCAVLLGEDGTAYQKHADSLREKIDCFFWNEEKGAYIDSYESGKENVTRHANIFALLFDIADAEKKASIIENVLKNDAIPPITTPYFKFYELEAMCVSGDHQQALDIMRSYWGGMLDLGATSVWEEYDPALSGIEHYAMYGGKYHKSLCHAWGASPIYLIGRYFLGVKPVDDGYAHFVCEPHFGDLEWVKGTVPVNSGIVSVEYNSGVLTVTADRDGGTLIWKDKTYPLLANIPVTVK